MNQRSCLLQEGQHVCNMLEYQVSQILRESQVALAMFTGRMNNSQIYSYCYENVLPLC